MKVILSLGLALPLLVACSQPRVFEVGPDKYMTSATSSPTDGPSEAERLALVEANKHCANMGKEIIVMKSINFINIHGWSKLRLTFRCLAKGSPLVQGPGITQTLDVSLKTHNNEALSQSAGQENQPSLTVKSH